jgi:hypothetical protein
VKAPASALCARREMDDLSLPCTLPPDLVESAVQSSTGKAVVLGHAGCIQIFDYDCLEPSHHIGCQFVRRMFADTRQSSMQLR